MAPPSRLQIESADLIAAQSVRSALERYVNPPSTIRELVQALYVDGKIDELTYSYVLHNASRFTICPPPIFFEARWLLATADGPHVSRQFAT